MPVIDKAQITGMVLAGGRGSRMGGVDKGLQAFRGMPLAMHALFRLQRAGRRDDDQRQSQPRRLRVHGRAGLAGCAARLPGPLAGFLAGLERCETPYLVVVPCDTPLFPDDLVERLAAGVRRTRHRDRRRRHPRGRRAAGAAGVLHDADHGHAESLVRFTHEGQRKIDRWTALHATRLVDVRERRRLRQRQHRRRAATARSAMTEATTAARRAAGDRLLRRRLRPEGAAGGGGARLPDNAWCRACRRSRSWRCAPPSAASLPRTSSRRSTCRRRTSSAMDGYAFRARRPRGRGRDDARGRGQRLRRRWRRQRP